MGYRAATRANDRQRAPGPRVPTLILGDTPSPPRLGRAVRWAGNPVRAGGAAASVRARSDSVRVVQAFAQSGQSS